MLKGFSKGGVHPPGFKISRAEAIVELPPPTVAVIPLSQHIGAPAVPCVAKGDRVVTGQLIAAADGFVSANVHSSVSGTVTAVGEVPDAGGVRRPAITIAVEGDQWLDIIDRSESLVKECHLTRDEIITRIKNAGIVGMGGATFPTHVKLSVPVGKKAEFLIVNGVECEPFLTADHRVMLERGAEMLVGTDILSLALGVDKAYIGIENNKPDAIEHLRQLSAGYPDIEVVPLRVRYPQGGEKQLIEAVLGREVPSGGLPIDVGAVVQNAGTTLAVYEAVQKNKPLIEYGGGMPEDTGKIVNGGPMMGRAVANPEAPVTKGTSGILLIRRKGSVRKTPQSCIKCAKCVGVCPMGLEPYLMYGFARRLRYEELEAAHITDCIECGCCSYTCPAYLPLLDYIRLGKSEVAKILRARKAR